MIDFRKTWEELAKERVHSAGFARRRVPLKAGLEIFVALSYPEKTPCLLFDIDAKSLPSGGSNPACKGFSLSIHLLQPESRERALVVLELLDRQYMDVFIVLMDDVLADLETTVDEITAVQMLLSRVQRWKDFFEKQKEQGLTKLEQQGLYGELWVMRNFLMPAINPGAAVSAWKGPDGANQDFHIASYAVEVKTSTSNPHEKIHISNVLQLDFAGLAGLFLVHLALDPRAGAGETLPGMVDAIRQSLEETAPHVVSAFNALLVKAGYFDVHAEHYNNHGYIVRHDHYYRVQSEFPRLLESQLLSGVGDVRYSIAVSSCQKYLVTQEHVAKTLNGESVI